MQRATEKDPGRRAAHEDATSLHAADSKLRIQVSEQGRVEQTSTPRSGTGGCPDRS
jgi:hypothetical protein